MAKFKFTLLLILAIFCILSTEVVAQDTGCMNITNNLHSPFLKFLGDLPLNATLSNMNQLSTTTDVCDGIWDSAGRKVCCDTRRITTAFYNMVFDGFTNWKNFVKSLVNVRRTIQNYNYNRDDLELKLTSIAANPAAYDFGGVSATQLLSLFDWAVGFSAELKLFRTQGFNCFTNLTATRAATTCEGCVYQKVNTYFTNEDVMKIRFKSTTCNSLWVSCSRSWRFVTNTQLLHYTLQQLNLYDKQLTGQVKLSRPDIFFNWKADPALQSSLLKDGLTALNTCISGECDDTKKQDVCQYMFNVIQSDRLYRMPDNLLLNMSIYKGSAVKDGVGQVVYVDGAAHGPSGPGIDIALAKPSIGRMTLNSTQLAEIDLPSAGGIRSGMLLQVLTTAVLGLILTSL